MKVIIYLTLLVGFLISCDSHRATTSSAAVSTADEPTYLKDRRLEEYSKATNSHGSSPPGNGGSYASGSYRQSALELEANGDSIPKVVNETVQPRSE